MIRSKHGVPIRLTDERWAHIIEQHSELSACKQNVLDTVADPERILAGNSGELIAVRLFEQEKWLVVIYREFQDDGFIITAFFTRRQRSLDKREVIWSQ